ncbi:hypothetical protein EPUS_02966 [Endocarpon pusillum Z07020]|uniref:Uncharacterized protein n=1 Tax=Endocarpon pusillum (strain Z07020 / HMAS-L-300199) TaxID=1263415 RepID=U1HP81_ENDPU|nr:uncharacterized protein EPUS_02966 [Endocarpon pusillum Z07020]ERF72175.1 hypothetical protein EPUS_02966 [Endocarpon pusillum Z07020]
MTEEGEEADFVGGGRKPSRRERIRDRLLKKVDKPDKPKAKQIGHDEALNDFLLKSPGEGGDVLPRFPSPTRKPVPRINVSSSPRWPEAQNVTSGEAVPQPTDDQEATGVYVPTKPRRREGLTVSFTKNAPEIIGEGGNEAEAPTLSIHQTRQSVSAHTFAHDGRPQNQAASAATVSETNIHASSTLTDPPGQEFRPQILVRAPTGLGEATRPGESAIAASKSMQDAGFERTVTGRNTAQPTAQSNPGLRLSSATGLKQKMLEEEARALTSARRDSPPESILHRQNATPPRNSREYLPATSVAPQAQREDSPSALANLLSPQGHSPSPSRPSSSSSYGSTEQSLEVAQGLSHRATSSRTSPRRKPVPKPSAPESTEDALAEFRSRVRRYYGLFVLSAENTGPGLDASLSRWMRAAAWWFLTAETNFKLLRRDLEEGVNIMQISTSRRLMQAVVDLAKTAWILEDIFLDYAKAESLDLSNQEAIGRLIESDPLSRFSRTLQYWQDLSKRLESLVAAVRRNGFMAPSSEDVPLSPGIDSTIWLTHAVLEPGAADWFRSANPPWIRMDHTVTPVEPFDLAEVIPLNSTTNTFRMRSMFCHISGRFQNQERTAVVPCILTIARRRGSHALVLFMASQDHDVNVVFETDPVHRDRIEWQQTLASVFFNSTGGFQFQIQLQQADFLHLKDCYDLAKRALSGTVLDVQGNANFREILVFKATAKTFERRSTEKINSFPYVGEQRDCEIFLFEKTELLRDRSTTRKAHRGFRLSVILSPYAANLGILDVHIGGDKPILLHSSHDNNPPLVELMDYRRASLLIQFPRNKDFNGFYELLTSLNHSANQEPPFENVPLHSFSIEPSSSEARMFFSAAPWRNVQITIDKGQNQGRDHITNTANPAPINTSVFSTHGVFADRLSQGRSQVYMALNTTDPTMLHLLRNAQQDISIALRFRAAPPTAPAIATQILSQSRTHPTTWKYTFATPHDLHTFQKCLTGSEVLFDGTASSFLVSRGTGLRTKKADFGVTRIQLLHDSLKQRWQMLTYFEDGGQAMQFGLDGNDVFERSNSKGKYSIKLVEVKISPPSPAPEDGGDEKKGFLCVEETPEGDERDDILISFEAEETRDRLAHVLPSAVKKTSSLMGALHLR